MPSATIEAIAHRLVAARDEVRRLKRLRAIFACEREARSFAFGDEEPSEAEKRAMRACWKATHEDYDPETGGGGWYYDIEPDEWCEPCKAREVVRLQIGPAQRRAAGLMSALVGAVRRSP